MNAHVVVAVVRVPDRASAALAALRTFGLCWRTLASQTAARRPPSSCSSSCCCPLCSLRLHCRRHHRRRNRRRLAPGSCPFAGSDRKACVRRGPPPDKPATASAWGEQRGKKTVEMASSQQHCYRHRRHHCHHRHCRCRLPHWRWHVQLPLAWQCRIG